MKVRSLSNAERNRAYVYLLLSATFTLAILLMLGVLVRSEHLVVTLIGCAVNIPAAVLLVGEIMYEFKTIVYGWVERLGIRAVDSMWAGQSSESIIETDEGRTYKVDVALASDSPITIEVGDVIQVLQPFNHVVSVGGKYVNRWRNLNKP